MTDFANPVNAVQQGFTARTAQTQEVDRQKDNDMLKVFEFAGDGQVEAAKYLAQAKGLQVPDQIYANADFSKGLALSGKIYPTDPVAAHKFVMAWSQNPDGDLMGRINAGTSAAGVPVDPKDRELQRTIALEVWKQNAPPTPYQRESLDIEHQKVGKPRIDRFQAGQHAYDSVMQSGMSTAQQAEDARQAAYKAYDSSAAEAPAPPGGAGISPGLAGMPGQAPSTTGDPVQDSLNAIAAQQAQTGVSPGQRPDLVQPGAQPPAAPPQQPAAAQPRASGYAPSGGQNLPVMHSAAEASRLAPGTSFMTPDGRIKVRP